MLLRVVLYTVTHVSFNGIYIYKKKKKTRKEGEEFELLLVTLNLTCDQNYSKIKSQFFMQ